MSTLIARNEGGILHLTLNRPEVRNAMSLEMVGELQTALAQAEGEGNVRAIVLRGAGGHFCSGGDIKDMAGARMRAMARKDGDPDPVAEVNAAFGRLCVAYARTSIPVVAVAEGSVMGGGFGLACVSDVTLASADAQFRLPETSLGIVPAQIAPFLVERLGYAEAKRLAVTGGRIDAQEALTIRLVHKVAADKDALDAALVEVLTRILACAPEATAATKALIARARTTPPEALVNDAAAIFSRAASSPEGQEGMTAFLEKRPPKWAQQATL